MVEEQNFTPRKRKSKKFDPDKVYGDVWEARLPWMRWRWEFRRRDPEYKTAWRARLAGDTDDGQVAEKFEIYGGRLLDPEKSFDALCLEAANEVENRHMWLWLTFVRLSPFSEQAVFSSHHWEGAAPPWAPGRLMLVIDFEKVNSITALQEDVARRIAVYWHTLYSIQSGKPRRKTRKLFADSFDRILIVGDRLGDHDVPDEWITYELANELDILPTQVRKDHRRFLELTRGGWRDLTFP